MMTTLAISQHLGLTEPRCTEMCACRSLWISWGGGTHPTRILTSLWSSRAERWVKEPLLTSHSWPRRVGARGSPRVRRHETFFFSTRTSTPLVLCCQQAQEVGQRVGRIHRTSDEEEEIMQEKLQSKTVKKKMLLRLQTVWCGIDSISNSMHGQNRNTFQYKGSCIIEWLNPPEFSWPLRGILQFPLWFITKLKQGQKLFGMHLFATIDRLRDVKTYNFNLIVWAYNYKM